MRKILWVLLFLFCLPPYSSALDDNYPPFDIKAFKDRMLNTAPINRPDEKGEFQDKDLTISWVTKTLEFSTIKILHKEKLIKEIKLPDGEWTDFLGEIYYVDLDHNGLQDVVISPSWYGSGLGSFYKMATILFQVAPGKFRQLQFLSFYFEERNFVDLDGDGKLELLMMQLAQLECSDGKIHSFWTYIPYRIKDFHLMMDKNIPDFPKFIGYSQKANGEPTSKLSQRQKDQYLDTLPVHIMSRLVSS
jgi:hypothetical protein